MNDPATDPRICRRDVSMESPGSACRNCGHPTLIHPMGGSTTRWCSMCEIDLYLKRLRKQARKAAKQ